MSNVDWSKAPEGATHYAPRWEDNCMYRPVFWRVVGNRGVEAWAINADGTMQHHDAPGWISSDRSRLIPRPTAPQWNGEGLPPVGATVEYKGFRDHWKQGSYVGQFRGQIVIGCHESGVVGICESAEIRPIRTPEQIAAEEREKAIKAMVDVLQVSDNLSGTAEYIVCGILHDAGYRKLEQPE